MAFTSNQSTISAMERRKSAMRLTIVVCGLFLFAGNCLLADAQATKAPISQPAVDQGIVVPPSQALAAAVQDKTALDILHSYQTAVGRTTWTDIEATGEIFPGKLLPAGAASGQGATLRILGHQGYRLDIQTPKGPISIRMDGAYGGMQPPGSHVILMDAPDAVTGLLAFPQLQDPAFPEKNISLIDQGTVSIDGVVLHRITVEAPWAGLSAKGQQESGISITDLYFDPATQMLVKSANALQGTDRRRAWSVRVVSYGDYRTVSSIQLPYLLSESLNGRRIWTLKLNQVQFNRGINETDFRFSHAD